MLKATLSGSGSAKAVLSSEERLTAGLTDNGTAQGILAVGQTAHGTLAKEASMNGWLTLPESRYTEIYSGPYFITPSHSVQLLNTEYKVCTQNITVDKVEEPELMGEVYRQEIALADTGFDSWTPSTSATSIQATAQVDTFVADMSEYEYLIKWETSVEFVLNSGATLKAQGYWEGSDRYQKIVRRPNSWADIQALNHDSNVCVTAFQVPFYRYYNTSGTLTYTYSTSYGIYSSLTAATFSSSTSLTPTVRIRRPVLYARCNSTYFATARASEVDKANTKVLTVGTLYRTKIPGLVRQMYDDFYRRII